MTRTIGEAIEGRLHEMRIQQKELATVIDVPVSTLNSWLRLGRDIPAQYILKIAHVLRCTPTYLLSGGEEDHEPLTRSDAIEDRIRPLRPRKHIHQFGPVFAPPLCDAKQHPASVQVFVRGIIVGSFKDLAHVGKIEIHEITPLWGL